MDHSLDQQTVSDPDHSGSTLAQTPLAGVDDGSFARASSASAAVSDAADGRVRAIWIWAICGFLLLAVGLVFGQTVRHEFIPYDDDGYVYDNPHVTAGLTLSGLWYALTDGPYDEWFPLTTLSHMLDCQLYGLKPAGHHLTNVLLHAASSVLLFLVLLRMTGDLWPSAWVAAVFAIHPLHVESVAWVAERRDVLSGLFFMLTLLAYALYAERPSLARYLAVAGCLALGLMSKPMLVTVPFLLLLLDYWPLHRFRRAAGADPGAASRSRLGRLPVAWRLAMEKIPLLALSALCTRITMSGHGSLRMTDVVDRLSLTTRVANAVVAYAAYVRQSFYPVDLALLYPHLGTRLPMAWVIESLLFLVAITLVALYCWRRRPYLPVGWFWFLGTLMPVIGLVGIFLHGRADRYTYLSQIGLSIALAWGAWDIYQSRQSLEASWRGRLLAVVSGAAVLALGVVAWRQTSYWRDAETLWLHTLSCTEQNLPAHFNLGYIYAKQGRLDEAIGHLHEAVATDSISPMLIARCHGVLGDCLTTQGRIDEALAHYEETVRLFPAGELGHTRFAMALGSAGRHDRAIAEWRASIRLSPALWSAHVGLANELLAIGDASGAATECREVLAHEPGAVEAIVTLGAALASEGHVEEALPYLRRVLELQAGNVQAHFQLGLALYDRGRAQSAIDHLNEAIRLQPDDARMLWPVAWILATSPDPTVRDGARGVELATRAIELSKEPEPRAIDALAAALAETGKFSAAVEAAEQASTIALTRGDEALADAIEQRIRLYRQGMPYRQSAASRPAGQAGPEERR